VQSVRVKAGLRGLAAAVVFAVASCGGSQSSSTDVPASGGDASYLTEASVQCGQAQQQVLGLASSVLGGEAYPSSFPSPKFIQFYGSVRPVIVQLFKDLDDLGAKRHQNELRDATNAFGDDLLSWVDRAKAAAAGRDGAAYQLLMGNDPALSSGSDKLRAAEQTFFRAHPGAGTSSPDSLPCSDLRAGAGG
jgi:hypothetical protein